MMPHGRLGGEIGGVGAAVTPICETVPQGDMVFGRLARGGRGIVPLDSGALEVHDDQGGDIGEDQGQKRKGARTGHPSKFWSCWGW